MKNTKELLRKSAVLFTSTVLLLSISCAHNKNETFSGNELAGSEESTEVASDSAPSEASDNVPTPQAEDLTASKDVGSSSTPDTAYSSDAQAASIESVPADAQAASIESVPADAQAASIESVPAESQTSETAPNASEMTESTVTSNETPAQPELVVPSPSAAPEQSSFDTRLLTDATPSNDGVPAADGEVATPPQESKQVSPSHSPKLPGTPVTRNGKALNRYYFLRKGDTATTLSRLFYGSETNAANLAKWNGDPSTWRAGGLVFYASSDQPQDTEMQSFYQENGVTQETYEVKPGDQLSTIAQQRFGHLGSWKEIAALNRLSNPDLIEPKQRLTVYPVALTSIQAAAKDVEADAEMAEVKMLPEPPPVAKAVEMPTRELNTQSNQAAPSVQAMEKGPKEENSVLTAKALPPPDADPFVENPDEQLASMDMARSAGPNFALYFFAGAVGLVALFLVLYFRARRRARAMEFME